MSADPHLESFLVADVRISAVDLTRAVDHFFQLAEVKKGGSITPCDAHGIVTAQTDERLRGILNAGRMTLPDGMPMQWIGRLKGAAVTRVHGHDFFEGVMKDRRAARIRHYFYGGKPEVLELIVNRATRLVGIDAVAGAHSPPVRPIGSIENPAVIAEMSAARPDVIWLGLGLPKQEYWIVNHIVHFPATLLVGIGAAFDYFAGVQYRAPELFQQAGLEWLTRLAQEPKRLWPRYSRVVPKMLWIMASEVLNQRRASPPK
jgi:N-acetylglucosaminyldiphosphoundecaprenol N-acetyl-beta-D-mannosaminyltransferase